MIAQLLTKQVRKRYTAKEALLHPWIVNRAKLSDKSHMEKYMVSRLVNFTNVCEFKLVITNIFKNQFYKMRPQHFHQLEQLFIQYDKDKDGVISFSEFSEAIASIDDLNIDSKHLEQIYNQLTTKQPANEDDEKTKDEVIGIQFSDLLNALVYDYLVSCDERLYDAFRKLDDDNDGKITTKELKAKLKQIDPMGEWDRAMKIIEEQSSEQDGVIDVRLLRLCKQTIVFMRNCVYFGLTV